MTYDAGSTSVALRPGIIPLRPLTLSDIFNGAVIYIRTNPKATLGLTTVVVVVSQVIVLALQAGPLAALGAFDPSLQGEGPSAGALTMFSGGVLAGLLVTVVANVLLTGLLTVIVGRAVFGGTVGIGLAWQRLRPRLPALLGLTALQLLAMLVVGGGAVLAGIAAYAVGGAAAAVLLGMLLALAILAALFFMTVFLLFAPVLIVLEELGVFGAIARSFTLVKRGFLRVTGIWLAAFLLSALLAFAVGAPLNLVGQAMATPGHGTLFFVGLTLVAIGSSLGQIVTAPITAGATVLLYTDRRFRSEAFDLVLRTGATGPIESTDHLWLARSA